MHMLVIALAGSVSYVMKRPRIRLAWKTSFWLMATLCLWTALMNQNGSFAQPAGMHSTSNVSLLRVSNRLLQKDGPLLAPLMNAMGPKVPNFNRVNPRSTKRVTKWVTYAELLFSSYTMKKKFSKKGKGGKVHRTDEEKRDAMSHKNQKNQQWEEEKIEEAKRLWDANKDKPAKEKLSMRAIARKLKLPKTTVIERLSGRRQGEGHIAGGKRKARVLSDSKQAGQKTVTVTVLTELQVGQQMGHHFGNLYWWPAWLLCPCNVII